jgi:hypothetical protein
MTIESLQKDFSNVYRLFRLLVRTMNSLCAIRQQPVASIAKADRDGTTLLSVWRERFTTSYSGKVGLNGVLSPERQYWKNLHLNKQCDEP